MARLLQTKNPRRNPATEDGGQHDGDLNFRVGTEPGPNAADPRVQTYGGNSFDSSNQAHHHILDRLTQTDPPQLFQYHNDYST
jgi:hypothetical protein